uniref:Uncharacterized protein n=1 Tax=Oryza glumipatula TaxID=40148 RepID=A0A0D9YAH9_9ORYZ
MGKDLVFSIRLRGGSGHGGDHWQAEQGFHLGVSSKQSNHNGSHQMPPTHHRYLFYAHNHLCTLLTTCLATTLDRWSSSVPPGLHYRRKRGAAGEVPDLGLCGQIRLFPRSPRHRTETGRPLTPGRRQDTGYPRSGGKEGGREERDEEGERKREGGAGAAGTAFAGGGNVSGTRPGSPAHSGSRLRVAQGERHGSHGRRKSPCDLKYSR